MTKMDGFHFQDRKTNIKMFSYSILNYLIKMSFKIYQRALKKDHESNPVKFLIKLFLLVAKSDHSWISVHYRENNYGILCNLVFIIGQSHFSIISHLTSGRDKIICCTRIKTNWHSHIFLSYISLSMLLLRRI